MRTMILVLLIITLLVFFSPPPAFAAVSEPESRWWLMVLLVSMFRNYADVKTAVFYTPQFNLEPGFLMHFQKEEQPTHIDLGMTSRVFSLGLTTHIAKSDFYLSGGYASRQDRLDSMYYLALTWRAATW